jgi:hypothetical protein
VFAPAPAASFAKIASLQFYKKNTAPLLVFFLPLITLQNCRFCRYGRCPPWQLPLRRLRSLSRPSLDAFHKIAAPLLAILCAHFVSKRRSRKAANRIFLQKMRRSIFFLTMKIQVKIKNLSS